MLAAVGCGMLSWRYPKQKVVLTGLRGSILPPLPPSSAGTPTVFQAAADQCDVLAHPISPAFWSWVGGGGHQAGAAKQFLKGLK